MSSSPIRIAGVLFALLLAGCAVPVSTNIKASPADIAKYSSLSDLDVVVALEKNVNEARSANMPFLAPHYFREASQVLSECQGMLGNKPKDVLVNNAAKGDAILEKGRAMIAIVQYRFAQELELKTQLDAINTEKLLPKEYEKVIADLSGLIEKIERDQPGGIDKDKDALLKAMQALEIKSVQEGALRESEDINTDSKKKNAELLAPETFAEALRVFQTAKIQIAAAHHDAKLVQRLSTQALFAAHHAQQVNERVTTLRMQLGMPSDGKPSGAEQVTVEQIILQEEDRLLAISGALEIKDLRDQPLEAQMAEIKRAATALAHQPRIGVSTGVTHDFEERLKAAEDSAQQALAQLAAKDQQLDAQATQLTEKDAQIKTLQDKTAQMEAQAAQLADKDAQIKTLSAKVAELEAAKPTAKPKKK